MQIPNNVLQWLHERGLADSVIEKHNLSWNGNQIVIPIYDYSGKLLFNKYRRNPFSDEGPKYIYDAGSTAQLFWSLGDVSNLNKFIIVEGEMDAMRLESAGLNAVSTTGGAGTWRDEWNEYINDNELYIAYDNDAAGLQGAIKLLTKIDAGLIVLPRNNNIKDITDYLQNYSIDNFNELIAQAESFPFLRMQVGEITKITQVAEYMCTLRDAARQVSLLESDASSEGRVYFHYQIIKNKIEDIAANLQHEKRRLQDERKPRQNSKGRITPEDIANAKLFPLSQLYHGKLIQQGDKLVGKCPFHEGDDTPSFTIYKSQNRFFCFGCNAGSDSIDYVMRRDGVDFIEAVKTLTKI